MLTMAGSSMLNICACWNGLILPRGVSMNTVTRPLPSMACSAAEPVSPLVAPTIVRVVSRRSSSYSNSSPSNCIAMSLNAAVGPFDRWPSSIPPVRSVTPTTRASPNFRRGVGALAQGPQVVGRDVVDEQPQHGRRQRRVALRGLDLPPGRQGRRVDARVALRDVQPAVGREALQEDVAERAGGRVGGAAGGDVLHKARAYRGPPAERRRARAARRRAPCADRRGGSGARPGPGNRPVRGRRAAPNGGRGAWRAPTGSRRPGRGPGSPQPRRPQ
jgi:hypothetical protein